MTWTVSLETGFVKSLFPAVPLVILKTRKAQMSVKALMVAYSVYTVWHTCAMEAASKHKTGDQLLMHKHAGRAQETTLQGKPKTALLAV